MRRGVRYSYPTVKGQCVKYYPLAAALYGKPVLVVGAGGVAKRKIISLREAGACVTAVAPDAVPELRRFAEEKAIIWISRRVERSDIAGKRIVVAATSDREVNAQVSRWANEMNIPVNVVDAPRLSTFISPAVTRHGQALVAVYTDGQDPVLSRDLKNYLKEHWDDFLLYRRSVQQSRPRV